MSQLQTPDNLSLKHRCYLSLVRGLARLPLPVLQAMGGAVGRLVYRFSTGYRQYFDANLIQAVGPALAQEISVRTQTEGVRLFLNCLGSGCIHASRFSRRYERLKGGSM